MPHKSSCKRSIQTAMRTSHTPNTTRKNKAPLSIRNKHLKYYRKKVETLGLRVAEFDVYRETLLCRISRAQGVVGLIQHQIVRSVNTKSIEKSVLLNMPF
jgi:hypothetical protein